MMEIISMFRGIKHAEIDLSLIGLIAGTNGAGKTSICQATSAALTQTGMPFLEPGSKPGTVSSLINKADAAAVIHSGAGLGGVKLTGATKDDSTTISWPMAKVTVSGVPPRASIYAAGLIRVSALDRKSRAMLLIDLLKAEPTREDMLADASPDVAAQIDNIIDGVQKIGWDAAADRFAERATKAKGKWEDVTGEKYGSAKAKTWTPVVWDLDLAGADQKELDAAVEQAQKARDAAIGNAAVSRAERDRLAAIAATIPELAEAATSASVAAEAAAKVEQTARRDRDSLPAVSGEAGYSCPWCEKPIGVERNGAAISLVRFADAPDPAEHDRRHRAIAAATDTLNQLTADASAKRAASAKAAAALADAERAKATLLAMPAERAETSGDSQAVAETNLFVARQRAESKTRHTNASTIAAAIARDLDIVALLRPTGARQRKLETCLAAFNDRLAAICETAGWTAVSVTPEMDVLCAGRPAVLIAASELYRCDVALQLAIAEIDGSAAVVIDGADILDKDNRNGLFKALIAAKIPALVAMTANAVGVVPDLAAAGLGQSYWVENGTATPIGDITGQRAA